MKQTTLELLGERLSLLHSQDALCLLRNAFSLPKVLYVLRTAPCFQSSILLDLDQLQRSLLKCICNIQLSNEAWNKHPYPSNLEVWESGALSCWHPLHFLHLLLAALVSSRRSSLFPCKVSPIHPRSMLSHSGLRVTMWRHLQDQMYRNKRLGTLHR